MGGKNTGRKGVYLTARGGGCQKLSGRRKGKRKTIRDPKEKEGFRIRDGEQ